MGSFKNKINNKKKKKVENAAVNELIELKKKMKAQYQAGEYVEAMDTMAELAERKKMDPEIMYMGASCYFMTGDYERAAKWVSNTLSYDPQNIAARLLLARLCFVQDKPEDGFEILNFVVEQYAGGIREEENTLLLEMLEYCSDNMAELMSQHSRLVEYFHKHYTPPAASVAPVAPKTDSSSIQAMLEASLTPKTAAPTAQTENAPEDSGKSKAQAAVDRLKSLLNKSKGNQQEGTSVANNSSANVSGSSRASADTSGISEPTPNVTGESAEAIITRVMNSDISFRDKIQSLNNFAGGMYVNGDYEGAMALLKQALQIDAHDPFVLKNMAFTCLAMGDKDKALEFASAMPMVEFGLLRAIKGYCHG
ncbi:tetratricopeptide repeat protein [Anaerovibrio lipolyticus]|uniref:tetratricopeptide repeat protein n=1 Tax=Anaerovibrio lipolyticus TaxID=82374 RepID=UPI0026EF299C|nr:tetratricopeptide repeat protein [Anaerovibrio lipolyticus]MBE6105135.1 tetratricopeptide repeat protein [Anaerovibrio lipolyticus]